MTDLNRCPSCGSAQLRLFHEKRNVPVNSCLLLDDRDVARNFPLGDIRLNVCLSCAFVFNAAFDRELSEYSVRYEETQGFSPRFVTFARELARQWVADHHLEGRDVLEIGCGKGEFLSYMVEAGAGHGIGIDPSFRPERMTSPVADRIEFIQDFYSEAYSHLKADAVVCRHTLEHISPVNEFMTSIRGAIGPRPDTAVLFELPDVLRVLKDIAFWDIYYEHCSYFTLGSLSRLFRRTNFDVEALATEFDDQYLLLEAHPTDAPTQARLSEEDDLDEVLAAVDHFEENYPKRIAELRASLESQVGGGRRPVIWGAGSKGVSYLTTLGLGEDLVPYAVDINPYKHGMYMAGTGQQVVAPSFLTENRPDVVIVMNGIYCNEIAGTLDQLGVEAEIVAV